MKTNLPLLTSVCKLTPTKPTINMNKRRPWQYFWVLLTITIISCTDPREQQIQQYIKDKNYSQLLSIMNTEVTEGNTQSLKIPSDRRKGENDSTLFIRATYSLLLSSTGFASSAGDVLLSNKEKINSYSFILKRIIDHAVEAGDYAPQNLDRFLYEVYTDSENGLNQEYAQKLKQIIRTDSVFIDRIKISIIRELNTEKDLGKIQELLDLARISAPLNLFDQVKSTEREYETARTNLSNRVARLTSIDDRIEQLESKYGKELIRQAKASYKFEGYMVAQLEQIAGVMVYEVRDMYANTYVLFTKTTRFTSKGFFSLRVVKGDDLTMKTTPSSGGFDANFPSITEVTEEWYNKYLLYTQEVISLESGRREIAQEANDNRAQVEALGSQLTRQKNELFNWIKSNVLI